MRPGEGGAGEPGARGGRESVVLGRPGEHVGFTRRIFHHQDPIGRAATIIIRSSDGGVIRAMRCHVTSWHH